LLELDYENYGKSSLGESMKSIRAVLILIIVIPMVITGCSSVSEPEVPPLDKPPEETPEEDKPDKPKGKCGDGICDQFETDQGICPEDCEVEYPVEYEKINEFEYYVINPTSGSKLYVKIYPSPLSMTQIPTIIFIPGGTGDSAMFTDQIPGGSAAEQFVNAGFHAIVFDPEGRGKSEGEEDFNGHIGQDGLYAVTKFIEAFPTVGDIGYLSQSYGVTLAAGVLARYKDGPGIFLIDWEGPANRNDTTVGCNSDNQEDSQQRGPQDRSCTDDAYWAEREAEVFASEIIVPYHRVQSLKDHVQPDPSNAVDMIRAATHSNYGGNGKSPWTRLNDFTPNEIFSLDIESELSEIDKEKYTMMIEYAKYLFEQYGGQKLTQQFPDEDSTGTGILYFGMMVHLEGWVNEADNEAQFNKHMNAARELADVFEAYGAKVTYEASLETITASGKWENVLLEFQNRGHGVGVHADLGYSNNPNFNLHLFTVRMDEMREAAEALGLTIQHVSGICSHLDWAKAAIDAGYQFTSGGVGYCAMSMPEEMRPEVYQDCPSPAQCHGNMPLDMKDRIHPWRISTALGDWTVDDPAGKLVNLASDGGIKNLYEASLDPNATHGDMEYSDEDITILVEKVEEALALSNPSNLNIIYFALSIGAADVDTAFYSKMFESLKPYVDSGRLEYKTLNEMYQAYISHQ
jgi:pimeloyl-ACP methyl ester carboxylesterase